MHAFITSTYPHIHASMVQCPETVQFIIYNEIIAIVENTSILAADTANPSLLSTDAITRTINNKKNPIEAIFVWGATLFLFSSNCLFIYCYLRKK